MTPESINGAVWIVAAYYYARWLMVAIAAWRQTHKRARVSIVAFTGAWLAFAVDRSLAWLGVIPGHDIDDWAATFILVLAVAALRWVYLEFRAGRLPPRFPPEVEP